MTIKLHVDIDRVTLDQLINLESAQKIVEIRDALAAFVVGDDLQPKSDEEAKAEVGKLTIREMRAATDQLLTEMKKANDDAVPPVKSGD